MEKELILTTKRLTIRKFEITDASKIYRLSQEEGIKKWMPDQVYSDLEQTKKVLEFLITQYDIEPESRKNPYVLGIEFEANQELIGHIGLSAIDKGIEIGYAITDRYQKKGLATEAVSEFSNWVVNNLSIKSVWGVVNKNNENSIKVLEKSNYKYIDKRDSELLYLYE